MSRYKHKHPQFDDGGWIDTETGAHIPGDPSNTDHQQVLKWIEDGGVPDPPDPPALVYSADERHTAQAQTTDGTPVELWRYTTSNRTGYDLVMRLIAVDSGNGAIKKQSIDATIARIGANPSLVGRTDTVSHATGGTRGTDAQVGAWKLDPSFEGYDLVLSVVGVVGRNVDWHVTIGMVRFAPEGM